MTTGPTSDDLQARVAELEAEVERLRDVERRLQTANGRLEILFEDAPDAIIIHDLKGVFIDGNRASEEMVGYDRAELIGKSFLTIGVGLVPMSQLPKLTKILALQALGRTTGPDELILNRKDGTRIWIEVRGYPTMIDGRRVVLGVARDVSRRRTAEEKARHLELRTRDSERREAAASVTAGLAHSFNNLLTPIGGFAQLIEMRAGEENRIAKPARRIQMAAAEAAELVQKLVDYARHEAVEAPTEVDLVEVVGNARAIALETTGTETEIVFEPAADMPSVHGHGKQLERAVVSLIINAIEASPAGGRIVVRAHSFEVADSSDDSTSSSLSSFSDVAETVPPGTWLAVEVSDEGPGIPVELHRRVFEPFFTTKDAAHGAGMGLAVTQGILATHGGHITLETDPSTVQLLLPPADGTPGDAATAP